MAQGQEGPPLDRQVMALLKSHCVKCHGPSVRKAALNLATPKGVARGGESGEAVIPGRIDESLLWELVQNDEMPPEEALSRDEKDLLRRWIEAGASGLPKVTPGESEGADHWAFGPQRSPEPPAVRDSSRVRNAIDHFLQSALELKGLTIGPEADRATLIRRVSMDLTGLPPTPTEIRRFRDDPAPDAYERLVERYLASPHYGERWGKLWLDAVGYADSNGYFNADTNRPLAYRYRDYIIRSFNEDRPLDRSLREQIAGDELVGYRPGELPDRSMVEGLVATHFLRNAPDGTGESDGNPDELRADRYAVLEGTTQVIGSALLGMTIQCARCHDHKFEPITQRDYYAIYAILAPAYNVESWVNPSGRIIDGPGEPGEIEAWEARSRRIDSEVADLTAEPALNDPFQPLSPDESKVLRQSIQKLFGRKESRPGRISPIAEPAGNPPEVPLLKRGLYGDPGPTVSPAPPSVLSDPDNPFEPKPIPGGTSGRRRAFAEWLTRPGSRASALLARVIANRLWQGHFGVGLVPTPENLGYSGAPPTNPELLEFLATGLARDGWSAKSLHRMILFSAAYRQSSVPDPSVLEIDPDNLLLGRFPLQRLDAETIRDAMLVVSGELDEREGGPYVPTTVTSDQEIVVEDQADGAHRRSVYLQQRRTQVLSMLSVFDAPSIVTTCTRRTASTMPLQSLSLLNSRFVVDRARGFSDRLRREAGEDPDRRISRAFLLATGRPPVEEERSAALKFLALQPGRYAGQPDAEDRAWVDFCQMLLCSNAFLYGG
ncbi:PSD1 and planctomycete cytochrome C domain-containing protein [Tundrisphaera lichenicola]|uniref:PSD1 and planctomycete cytochrome C domain-containing protein n=1 Tax=Tundrisphaera lichenicola TaxID=2029860 RepID=UPI003EB7D130